VQGSFKYARKTYQFISFEEESPCRPTRIFASAVHFGQLAGTGPLNLLLNIFLQVEHLDGLFLHVEHIMLPRRIGVPQPPHVLRHWGQKSGYLPLSFGYVFKPQSLHMYGSFLHFGQRSRPSRILTLHTTHLDVLAACLTC